jgi:hypothetical protein
MLAKASRPFGALSSDERRCLGEWRTAARAVGIDAVDDLTFRPWPCELAGVVIGVFTAGSETADWLVIGEDGAWAVACCASRDVSPRLNSLTDALATIYQKRNMPRPH